jgi:SET domain-containing protein
LQKFTGLNYSFQLNSTSILDALSVGNETRYINDSRELPGSVAQHPAEVVTPNCEASIRLVNDVHRIAITAGEFFENL